MKTRCFWSALFIALVALSFGACQSGPSSQADLDSGRAGEKLKFVYVSPNPLGVNEFLILGKSGLEQAAQKFKAETQVLESKDPATRAKNITTAVNNGADIVIVLSGSFNDVIPKAARQNPDVHFLIVDQCIENPPENVRCAVFREYEASFLIGVIAASLTKNNHIGVISAENTPFMHRFTDGYAIGARHIAPDIQVDVRWIGGETPFADAAGAKELALNIFAGGADQIFSAAGGSNWGVFEAAREADFMVYGVDVNQCPIAPGHIVESLIKRVDVAIVESISNIVNNSGEQVISYGLAEKGVGLVATTPDDEKYSRCMILEHPELLELVKTTGQQIINGEIKIDDPMPAR